MSRPELEYYHILVTNADETIQMAKDNPKFEFVPSASIEVIPMKTSGRLAGNFRKYIEAGH